MLDLILPILILFGLATFCFKALGHLLLILAWELYHLGIFPPARFFCSLAKLFFPKGKNPSDKKRWVEEGVTQLRHRSQLLLRELDLLQMETDKFRQELAVVQNGKTLSGDALKPLYERRNALAEDADKISEKHRLYELDHARFIHDVRNMGPWVAAYLFHEPI